MYLERLRVQNVRLIESLELDFLRSGTPRMWTVLLGENGLCKTTLLQCVALAALGVNKANQLLNSPRALRPVGSTADCTIAANFGLAASSARKVAFGPQGATRLTSTLRLEEGWNELQGHSELGPAAGHHFSGTGDPLAEIRGRSFPEYIVAGYGVTRTLPFPNSSSEPGDTPRDRLRSLFDSSWRITATDFISRIGRGPDADVARRFASVLRSVLAGDGGLLPNISHLELRGRGGVTRPEDLVDAHRFFQTTSGAEVAVPATWLSQGYQSTIAWLADLVGQVFLDDLDANPWLEPKDYVGLVLIDELDLHLHPRWQRHIVRGLKRVFPKLQFIVTTHSPLVLAGVEADEVVRLERNAQGRIVATRNDTNPGLLTPTELLNEFFGLDDTFPGEVGQQMHEYMRLALNPFRDEAEDAHVNALAETLRSQNAAPAVPPVTRKVR
ncbi:MAG: AAA family ATPase [Myxococcaceae bacterium]|nr:AAA family ATPase [Myxococcaceae bacterium]